MPQHKFHHTILRASDIRGIIDKTLFKKDAYYIGRCFATSIINATGKTNPEISVAYDGRLSSPDLKDALINGLVDSGALVSNHGCGPSPMLYFAVHHCNADAGIMVTGSHNPSSYNGFKMMIGKKSFFGEAIQNFTNLLENNALLEGNGDDKELCVFDDYLEALYSGFITEDAKDIKVAWDSGNGAAGDFVTALVKKLPGEHILLNEKIDGTFPAHHPDPTVPENLAQLIETVKTQKCDMGVAFDGDGDRVAAVDSTGQIIWGDQMMTFFSRDVLKDNPRATIIADVKSSQTLFDDIAAHGGRPIMWKTGHAFIKTKMAEEKALLAGEMSGHIFFADRYFGFDDGVYSAVRLINWVAHNTQTLKEALESLPVVYNTPEIRITTTEDRKFVIIDEIKSRLITEKANVDDIDGVRVMNENGWWLARASNTESAIIVRCEGKNKSALERLKEQVIKQLSQSNTNYSPLEI